MAMGLVLMGCDSRPQGGWTHTEDLKQLTDIQSLGTTHPLQWVSLADTFWAALSKRLQNLLLPCQGGSVLGLAQLC